MLHGAVLDRPDSFAASLAYTLPMDNLDPLRRSENMRRIRSKDTKPELVVRKLVRSLGFTGYRLHRKDILGKPDLAWVGRKLAIYVHGCFWHGHDCKEGIRKPKSRVDYWLPKLSVTASATMNSTHHLNHKVGECLLFGIVN